MVKGNCRWRRKNWGAPCWIGQGGWSFCCGGHL